MSVSIDWHIKNMGHQPSDGGVVFVAWEAVAKEQHPEDYFGVARVFKISGIVNLTPDPSDENFIPYQSLTHDQCISWVKDSVDPTSVEKKLTEKFIVDDSALSEIETGTPW